MEPHEIFEARAALIGDLSIRHLIEGLEGKLYADLVMKHAEETGTNLPATIAVHEGLVLPGEASGVAEALQTLSSDVEEPGFWASDAGDVLSGVSCHLNDALFPTSAEEAGVFNLFQLFTLKLAERARVDPDCQHEILELSKTSKPTTGKSGLITKILGIAISDYDAGRISRSQLLTIFQDSIDNGDIIEPDNQQYVVAHVVPLVEAGLLRPSRHLDTFEGEMDRVAMDFIEQKRLSGGIMEGLRWIVVLPASVAGSLVAFVAWRLINRITISMAGIDPDGLISTIYVEVVGTALLGVAFVYIAFTIAPRQKRIVAMVAGGICILAAGLFLFPVIMQRSIISILSCLALALGSGVAAVGLFQGADADENCHRRA